MTLQVSPQTKRVFHLSLPIFAELLLQLLVGNMDQFMISHFGPAAVAAIGNGNQVMNVVIIVLETMSAATTILLTQHIGAGQDGGKCSEIATVGVAVSAVFSFLMGMVLLCAPHILFSLLRTPAEAFDGACLYTRIVGGAVMLQGLYIELCAVLRSYTLLKEVVTASVVMNLLNVAGNAIGIFVLHAGVAGVAWPSTLSRAFAAVAMTALCFSQKNPVRLLWKDLLTWNSSMVRRLLRIAVPNSIENGLFQLAKVALSSITAMFGTVQIAANGVTQSIWSLAALVGSAMGPAFITVVGQCMGASDTEAADYYMRKLTRLTLSVSIAWNALVLLLTPVMLLFYDLSPEAKNLVFWLVVIHNIFNAVAYPISGPFSNGLRAAGDVKFTMYISLFSTIVVRVALSIVLGVWLNLGVIGIALAMAGDWCVKAAILLLRYKAGKWKTFRVLG